MRQIKYCYLFRAIENRKPTTENRNWNQIKIKFENFLNPSRFFSEPEIPDVGELMYASFPVDSQIISYDCWWLGEKYDGVRVCWNPQDKLAYLFFLTKFWIFEQRIDFLLIFEYLKM
eukprot:Phypoly_transcript_29055.p1 GENE.Phypoly_transcript_29055~~Phypoly_transcript_29055.p1  ORF type:complete len:117 (+),score=5.88 Phypoly_transcript_29055:50-400(+)